MKHTVGALVLSTFFRTLAFAAPPAGPPPPFEALVRVSAPTHRVCGSGFIDERGYLATNLHLIRALCPQGDCTDLRLERATAAGGRTLQPSPPLKQPSIHSTVPTFDLGFIDIGLPPQGLRYGSALKPGTRVTAYGFPGCGELKGATGEIVATSPLHLDTTVLGGRGNSGSPIINDSGEVVGIVDEASDLLLVIRRKTLPLRARRLDEIGRFILRGDTLPFELRSLGEFHAALALRPLSTRLRGSFDFIVAMRELVGNARRGDFTGELAEMLRLGERFIETPPRVLGEDGALNAERVLVDYGLYSRSSLFTGQILADYRSTVNSYGRSTAHLPTTPPRPTLADLNGAMVGVGGLLLGSLFLLVRWIRRRSRSKVR